MPDKYNFLDKKPSDLKDDDFHHGDNVVKATRSIFKKFIKNEEVVCCAEMQSGKTDVMKRMIYIINKNNNQLLDLNIDIGRMNIYLVICASSKNLKNELKEKLPEIKHRIYHLNDINSFLKNTSEYDSLFTEMADSSLIIFDECHCDAEKQKIIDRFSTTIDKFAKHNKTSYYKLYCSATPYAQILKKYPKVVLEPGPNYYGMRQMFTSTTPIVFQAKNLADPDECAKLFTEITVCNYYYIFRLSGTKKSSDMMIANLESEFKKLGSRLESYIYDMNYTGNLNELLETKPTKPTLIYLKDKLRMGEYLNTEFIYLVHDDPTNMYAHTTAQSLIGRCCGYNKKTHTTIIYCDYEKAWQHYQWIDNQYNIEYLPNDAKYIKKNGKETTAICRY